jgi:hypothetical protein
MRPNPSALITGPLEAVLDVIALRYGTYYTVTG